MNRSHDQASGSSAKVPFDHFEKMALPAYVTVTLEYFATGEGVTRGIFMHYVMSAEELRASLINLWGSHFAVGCEAFEGLVMVPRFEDIVPERVRLILAGRNRQGRMPHGFSFRATVHENYA